MTGSEGSLKDSQGKPSHVICPCEKKSWEKYCLGRLQPDFALWETEESNWGHYQQMSITLPKINSLCCAYPEQIQVIERHRRMEVCTSSLFAEVINRATADQGTTTKQHHVLWLVFLLVLTGEKMLPLSWDLPISLYAWKGTTKGTSYTMYAGCSALSAHIQKYASYSLTFTCSPHFSLTLSISPSE